jgi:hypothetical protein
MPPSTLTDNSNITINRRLNLLTRFQEFTELHIGNGGAPKGVEQLFAAQLQLSPSRLSQIKGSRPIGDKLARQIEVTSKRPSGWLDEYHPEQTTSPGEDVFLTMAREIWQAQNSKGKRELARIVRTFKSTEN